jgi:ribosomal protein L35
MPKLKTKKTLVKRVKITKAGKILKKQNRMGHLKSKLSSSRKTRKKGLAAQPNKGHINVLRKMLGKLSKGIK